MGGEILGRETEGDEGQKEMADRRTNRWTREDRRRGYPDRSLETRTERGAGRSRERQKGIKDGMGRNSCVRSIRQGMVAGVSAIPALGGRGRTGGYRPEWATG